MSFKGTVGPGRNLRRPIEFHLLGPLEVRDGSRAVLLRRRPQRVLLAVLALRAGERVPADVLVEEIWAGSPPRTARAALYNHVSQLRKEIGDGMVQTGNQGYMLVADPEQVDVLRFERLVAKARAAPSRKDRLAKLRDALDLWRGPPLADFPFEPFAMNEASRLGELYVDAREELIDAELEVGASASLIPELEALVAQHPFRERLAAQLMVALYRSGRQAEALERYRRVRKTFVELLGIDPGPELQRIHHAILCQDSSLEGSSAGPSTEPSDFEQAAAPEIHWSWVSDQARAWPAVRRAFGDGLVRKTDALLIAVGAAAERARQVIESSQRESVEP